MKTGAYRIHAFALFGLFAATTAAFAQGTEADAAGGYQTSGQTGSFNGCGRLTSASSVSVSCSPGSATVAGSGTVAGPLLASTASFSGSAPTFTYRDNSGVLHTNGGNGFAYGYSSFSDFLSISGPQAPAQLVFYISVRSTETAAAGAPFSIASSDAIAQVSVRSGTSDSTSYFVSAGKDERRTSVYGEAPRATTFFTGSWMDYANFSTATLPYISGGTFFYDYFNSLVGVGNNGIDQFAMGATGSASTAGISVLLGIDALDQSGNSVFIGPTPDSYSFRSGMNIYVGHALASTVPEPGSAFLLGTGLASLFAVQRRKRGSDGKRNG